MKYVLLPTFALLLQILSKYNCNIYNYNDFFKTALPCPFFKGAYPPNAGLFKKGANTNESFMIHCPQTQYDFYKNLSIIQKFLYKININIFIEIFSFEEEKMTGKNLRILIESLLTYLLQT